MMNDMTGLKEEKITRILKLRNKEMKAKFDKYCESNGIRKENNFPLIRPVKNSVPNLS